MRVFGVSANVHDLEEEPAEEKGVAQKPCCACGERRLPSSVAAFDVPFEGVLWEAAHGLVDSRGLSGDGKSSSVLCVRVCVR